MRENEEKELERLSQVWDRCDMPEYETLKYYCECMLKLCRIFYKIENTGMLSYIHQILSPTFPLMVRYFINRAEAFIEEKKEKEKVEILEDIEKSVVGFWEVQEAIIQSSNGADRILFQSAPLDSGTHYAAPKLCAYYSEMLNTFADFFDENEGVSEKYYAFCVYPTMNSQAEAERLFTTMEQKGKVGIIRVPGKEIADTRYIIPLLFHEFFHIVPGSLRLRKRRAKIFLNILLYDLETLIEENVDINNDSYKEILRSYLFDKLIKETLKEMDDIEEEKRFYYSRNIMENFANKIYMYLREAEKQKVTKMEEIICSGEEFKSFSEYKERKRVIERWYSQINTNISNICEGSVIQRKCHFYMGVFREAYADLLCVISLNIKPDQYIRIFRYTQGDIGESCVRIGLFLRVFFVKEIMCEDINTPNLISKVFEDWKKWAQHIEINYEQNGDNGLIKGMLHVTSVYRNEESFCRQCGHLNGSDTNRQINTEDMEVVPNRVILDRYLEYFRTCRDKYLEYLKLHEEKFALFQQRFLFNRQEINDDMNYYISLREWEVEES